MLSMINKYNIRTMYLIQGKSLRQIARETGHTFRTVRKYALQEDFSEKIVRKIYKKSSLEPFEETIDQWLISDLGAPRKQRHTAKRVYDRLCEEFSSSFALSYRTVAKYVVKKKKTLDEFSKKNIGLLSLSHLPGEAQLDFGESQFILNGEVVNGNHLVLSFPYSNFSYIQIFPSQNQEALFQGMKNIFEYIGKVPREIWFDNMSTAVAQIKKGKERKLTDKFIQFMTHYGFQAKFCNPYSGHEKGMVENKVGYTRRNLLVPIPSFDSLEDFNKQLLKKCEEDAYRQHYKKEKTIIELFEYDKQEMIPINSHDYEVFNLKKCKVNKVRYLKFEGNEYSVLPSISNEEVWLKIFVDKIEILNESYEKLTSHKRMYKKNLKLTNWNDWLKVLEAKITALEYTEFYQELPDVWKNYFRSKTPKEKKKIVSALAEMLFLGDLELATKALEYNLARDITDISSLLTTFRAFKEPNKIYAELTTEELPMVPCQEAIDIELSIYDKLMGGIHG